jgi:hypothetical protein
MPTKTKTATPKIETVDLSTLRQDPTNARVHGRHNLASIASSLVRFGQVRPLLVTKDGMILAGNGTYEALKHLGLEQALVMRLPWDDPEKCRAYAIADNRTAELASWDDEILNEQLGDLARAGINMGTLGFTDLGSIDPDDLDAGERESALSYRCPSCGFRWRYEDGGAVVPL